MSDVKRLLAEAREVLTPLLESMSHDPADGFMRKCIDRFYCGGMSKVLYDPGDDAPVEHREGCDVARLMDRLPDYEAAVDALERLAGDEGNCWSCEAAQEAPVTIAADRCDAHEALARLREKVPA